MSGSVRRQRRFVAWRIWMLVEDCGADQWCLEQGAIAPNGRGAWG
jgi:hypothetical protein